MLSVSTGPKSHKKKPGNQLQKKSGRQGPMRHWLIRALGELHSCTSVADLITEKNLYPQTADVQALKKLAQRSTEFIPALDELRSQAADREILLNLVEKQAGASEALASEGETSADECRVTSQSSANEGGPRKEAPLVLPPGWQVQRVRRHGRELCEFVDPRGIRYRTEAQAKQAVSGARRLANMANRLKSKFSAAKQENGLNGLTPNINTLNCAKQESEDADAEAKRRAAAVRCLCDAFTEGVLPAESQLKKVRLH